MSPRPVLIAGMLVLAATLRAAPQQRVASVDLVELDVVVTDGAGQPIRSLQQSDFQLEEDGKAVELTTFQEIALKDLEADRGRSIVIMLDEAGIPASGTPVVRQIARAFLASVSPYDEVSVVRLHNWRDEPFGDRRVAEFRIAEYQAGTIPFTGTLAQEEVLRRVIDISDQLQVNPQKKKIIVCIGSPFVCNVEEPARVAPRNLWGRWLDALRATASANVSFYLVVPSRMSLFGGGLASFTGGQVFATTYDVGPAIDRILQDASYHYVLGYWPPEGRPRELHSLKVKVNRRGAKVNMRPRRVE